MRKHTLIHAGVAVDNPHQYNVVIGTDIGQYSGTVVCREEDYAHESQYFGFELAEIKAEIAYARAKRNYWEAQAKGLTEFWRMMTDTRTYNPDDFWVKKMKDAVDNAFHQRAFWMDRVDYLKELYTTKIKLFDETNKRLQHKRG